MLAVVETIPPHLSVPGHLYSNAKKVLMSEQSIPHSGGSYSTDDDGNTNRASEGHTGPMNNAQMPSVCKRCLCTCKSDRLT